MGSFVYMIARDDADIIEEKRPEFEERLEKVFNAAGIKDTGVRIYQDKQYGLGLMTWRAELQR